MMNKVVKVINQAFGSDYRAKGSQRTKGETLPGAQVAQGGVPKFGIKGRAPLKSDKFERSSEIYKYKGGEYTLDELRAKTKSDVYRHEAAHLAKAGKYATTGICIDFDGRGIATGGHVGISMPSLNKENPGETIDHARAVIASAEAPASFDELSDADRNVAANARAVLAQALAFKSSSKGSLDAKPAQRKPLNYIA